MNRHYLFAFFFTVAGSMAHSTEYFVAPTGTERGDGSIGQPWDLATALSHPAAVKPGDLIWLRGGNYRGDFVSQLVGSAEAPITVRQYPGERATIDLLADERTASFLVRGERVRFWGFELTCSHQTRYSETGGPFPGPEIRRGSIDCRGSHIEFINLVVHDLGVGFGFWSEGEGGEIYGCLIYNNGWKAPDRGHGHAIYTQNVRGTKRIVDNILFNQFSHGIHAYGSAKAMLEGYHIEGNVSFNNGLLAGPENLAPNILVGGDTPARRIRIDNNFTYHSAPATGVRLGYGSVNDDLTLGDNYFAGYSEIRFWKQVTVHGNTFIGADSLVRLELPDSLDPGTYKWDRNIFHSSRQRHPPLVAVERSKNLASSWTEWNRLGMDREGKYAEGPLAGVKTFVRPNRYERGRAHVVVYNWDKGQAVDLDLKKVLQVGQRFRIVRAQDYFGPPVLSGTFQGQLLSLPMAAAPAALPIGLARASAAITAPEFEVFVVLPD